MVATVAVAFVVGGLALRDPQPPAPGTGGSDRMAPLADRVAKLVPFQRREERPLASGGFRVEEQNDRFTLVANQAWRIEILEALAERGDFSLVDHVRRHPLVSLDVRDETLERVLAQVVNDTPYAIRYAFADGSELAIDSLEVGVEHGVADSDQDRIDGSEPQSKEGVGREAKAADLAKRTARKRRSVEPRSEADRRFAMERRQKREADRHERYLQELEHPDPEVRRSAASALDVEEPRDLVPLAGLLGNDPDPDVRAEIAFNLGFGDPATAVPLLLSALDDPAPAVVVAAADALGYLDDPSVIGDLQALQGDESESVREAARGAVEMLGDAE